MKLRKSAATRENLAQLVARSFTEPARFIQKMHQRFFRELSENFVAELQRTYPKASQKISIGICTWLFLPCSELLPSTEDWAISQKGFVTKTASKI